MKQNLTGTHYRTLTRNVQLLIDESFAEKIIPADDSVRLLDKIVEEMDLSPLHRAYERHGRRPATAPSTMLKVFADSDGLQREQAALQDTAKPYRNAAVQNRIRLVFNKTEYLTTQSRQIEGVLRVFLHSFQPSGE